MYSSCPELTSEHLCGWALSSRLFTPCNCILLKFFQYKDCAPAGLVLCVFAHLFFFFLGTVFSYFFILLFLEPALLSTHPPPLLSLELQQHFSYVSFILSSSLSTSDRCAVAMKTITGFSLSSTLKDLRLRENESEISTRLL